MNKLTPFVFLAFALIFAAYSADAQTTRAPRPSQQTTLSNNDISTGLREAIIVGVRKAVDELGRDNGFLGNDDVRIPLPQSLAKMERTLRMVGQGRKVDEFVAAMNHAAEKAVPVATDIFIDSIRQMTFDDARRILFSGEEDAATQFFRRTSEQRLRVKFRPIVEDFTEQVGVTQKYKAMSGRLGGLGRLIGEDVSDIDGYVTEKAMDGLFLLLAREEAKIRRDPVGRTTSILRKVFGGLK